MNIAMEMTLNFNNGFVWHYRISMAFSKDGHVTFDYFFKMKNNPPPF